MTKQPVIAADLQSAYELSLRKPQKEIGLYFISSNRELLKHVEKVMIRYGEIGGALSELQSRDSISRMPSSA